MSTMPDVIDPQTKSRRELDDNVELLKARAQSLARRHGGVVVVVTLTALAAFGLGVMVSRRRMRQSLGQRLHAALPDSVRDLPDDLAEQLKRLRSAARAL